MALFGGFFGGGGDKGNKPIYSIAHLQQLFDRLQNIKDTDEQNRDNMVEVIRQMTEALIWGEQNGHDQHLFDFFCEKNILAYFVNVLGRATTPKTVKVQLLQTLSMLVQNIRRDTSLYYLFSNNYVNALIWTQYDWNDEEILSYYISFLKSLALRLNSETIKFFFSERSQQFPLYIEAVRFFGHRDQMVRTAVRNITLQVYSIEDDAMRNYVLERSATTYFVHLACYLRELWLKLDNASRAAAGSGSDQGPAGLHEVFEEQQDLLMYISDVLDLKVPGIGEALAERLLHYAFFPVLLGGLLTNPCQPAPGDGGTSATGAGGAAAVASAGAVFASAGTGASVTLSAAQVSEMAEVFEIPRLSPACALFVLHQVLDCCRSRIVLEPLANALLRRRLPGSIRGLCLGPPPPQPATYRATTQDVSGPASVESPATVDATVAAVPKLEGLGRKGQLPSDERGGEGGLGGDAEDGLPEASVRAQLLACLAGRSTDACALLAAGIVNACLTHRNLLPQALLEDACILPSPRRAKTSQMLGDLLSGSIGAAAAASTGPQRPRGASDASAPVDTLETVDGHQLEVLCVSTLALEQHAMLRVVTVQVLSRLCSYLASETLATSSLQNGWRAAPLGAARRAVRSAARQVRTYLHGSLGDGFLDVFTEEWEQHRSYASSDVREAASNIRCLLPPPAAGASGAPSEWTVPPPHSERQHAAQAIRCLLVIRRLHAELSDAFASTESGSSFRPPPRPPESSVQRTSSSASRASGRRPSGPSGGTAPGRPSHHASPAGASELDEVDPVLQDPDCPLHIAGEVTDGYQEGRSFELGRQDRIVCGVVAPEGGRCTRYLVLHGFLLLLVQPDLVNPGWASVRTLAPVRLVESQIDRTDPRTLRLGVRLAKGAPCPGEACGYDPTGAEPGFRLPVEEHRGSSFFMLTLSFEDVKRCDCAHRHLAKRRQEVRAKLRQRIEAFVDTQCS